MTNMTPAPGSPPKAPKAALAQLGEPAFLFVGSWHWFLASYKLYWQSKFIVLQHLCLSFLTGVAELDQVISLVPGHESCAG